jgi:CRISPR-associated protein Csm3
MTSGHSTQSWRGKVIIEGTLVAVTGLHIGAQGSHWEIGAVDSPVVRDPLTGAPYIPGSSLRGKLRSLVEWTLDPPVPFDKPGGRDVYRHECAEPLCPSCRVFGAAIGSERPRPGCLLVRDLFLEEDSLKALEAVETGLRYTEWKFENALDRLTSAANPRQIERIPAGSRFKLSMVYTLVAEPAVASDDIRRLVGALKLLEDDALGGHGSRGYGAVAVENLMLRRRVLGYYFGEVREDFRTVGHPRDLTAETVTWAVQ